MTRMDAAPYMGYPDYYQNNFHFQGDGWMSSKSADVYETSTETLFLGRQDAMQRQTLLPLAEHTKTLWPQSAEVGREPPTTEETNERTNERNETKRLHFRN